MFSSKVKRVLNDAESHWTQLKDKLIKTIELKEFRVSDHIYKDSINASRIPVINNEPSFILHSLPDSDNEEGYLDKKCSLRCLTMLWNILISSYWALPGKNRNY